MSDGLRAPGSLPGTSKGKSESQKNSAPCEGHNSDGGGKVAGDIATPVVAGKTGANRNKIR